MGRAGEGGREGEIGSRGKAVVTSTLEPLLLPSACIKSVTEDSSGRPQHRLVKVGDVMICQ